MTTPEPFDLTQSLTDSYLVWQRTYLLNMPPMGSEDSVEYADRMCCIAYTEGAKAIQLLMQKAFMETLAEQGK